MVAQKPQPGEAGTTPGRQAQGESHRDVIRVSAAAALGAFLFGYDTGVINGSVNALRANFQIATGPLGFVVSSALLGCAAGAWFAGPLAERVGRTRVMLLSGIVFAIGSVGASLALGPLTLTYWRVVQGLAIGAGSVMATAYIAEIAPASLRGRLGSLVQLSIVSGIVISLLINLVITKAAGGGEQPAPWGGIAWRWMFTIAAVPGLVFAFLATRLPESPRYLIQRGRVDEARQILQRFVGGDIDGRMTRIRRSLEGIGGSLAERMAELRGPKLGLQPVVWTAILLAAFQQLVGINVVFYYSSTVWRAVGFSEADALFTSLITGVVNLITTIVAVALIDRVGRRPLLLVGSAGMAVTLLVLAITFSTGQGSGQQTTLGPVAGVVALIAANLYVVSFAISWGPVMWVLLGEMFNNRIRAIALAVATAANWLANWLVSTSFPALSAVGLPVAYGIFAAFAIVSVLFVVRAVHETKGRELEEM
jgi:sugar porter (SP) family MFS transporter